MLTLFYAKSFYSVSVIVCQREDIIFSEYSFSCHISLLTCFMAYGGRFRHIAANVFKDPCLHKMVPQNCRVKMKDLSFGISLQL